MIFSLILYLFIFFGRGGFFPTWQIFRGQVISPPPSSFPPCTMIAGRKVDGSHVDLEGAEVGHGRVTKKEGHLSND